MGKRHVARQSRRAWVRIRQSITGETAPSFFTREYFLLRRHPQIRSLKVEARPAGGVAESVEVITTLLSAVIPKKFTAEVCKICLGRYRISLSRVPTSTEWRLVITCIQSGRHDGQRILTYALHGGPGGFCFGNYLESVGGRNKFIWDLLKQGELFVLITTILESLAHVNFTDHETFLLTHRQWRQGKLELPRPQGAAT